RSADQELLHIPPSRFKTKGNCVFSVVVPTLWNQLPLSICSVESVQHFKKLVKTYLYKQAFFPSFFSSLFFSVCIYSCGICQD
ncbi:hypothetical protein LDENG_00058580, partial [Lucifuga dentata]